MNKDELIISDTNIFLDLYETDSLKEFFSLPYEIRTTMLVFSEIKGDKELQAVKPFIDSGKLKIEQLSTAEFTACLNMSLTTPEDLSVTDCSVWQKAKQNNAKLITNDRKLRKAAENDKVEVHGILFVFEKMTEKNVMPYDKAINAVSKLITINKRCPKKQAQDLIDKLENCKKQTNKLQSKSDDDTQGY